MIRAARSLVALLLAGALASAPAAAFGDEPMVPGAEVEVSTLTGEIAAVSSTVLEADDSLRVTARIANGTGTTVMGETVHLRLTEAPLTSHEAVERFLDSPSSSARRTVATRPLGGVTGLAPEGESTLSLVASPEELDLPATRSGVYGVTVTVVGSDGAVTVDSMVLTWAPVAIPELQVAAVAIASSSQSRAEAVVANADLDTVSLLMDPTVSEGLSVGGHEVYRTLAGDADVTSLARGDGLSLLEFAEDAANDNAPHYPAAATLVPNVAVADQATLDAAERIGATAVLLETRFDPEGVTGGGDAAVVDVPTAEGSVPVIRPDVDLSTVLASYRPGTVAAQARIVAEAAIAAEASASGLVVVAPGQSWMLSEEGTSDVLRALLEAPWVAPVPLTTALAGEHPVGVPASSSTGVEDDLDAESVTQLSEALDGVALVASAATDEGAALEQYGLGLVRAASMESRARSATRDSLVERSLVVAHEAIDGISVATSADLNLIAEEGALPITVRNSIDQDVTVVVSAQSSSPNLRVTGRPEVVVPAGSELAVQIPVTAVSSANVNVVVVIRAASGEALSEAQVLTVRVRADWGSAATLVFSVLLALLLVAGVIRTVRRGRRDTRVGPGELSEAELDDATGADEEGGRDDAAADDAGAGPDDADTGSSTDGHDGASTLDEPADPSVEPGSPVERNGSDPARRENT
ncbi:DUF6049 family protein [Demequina zhanjiangensis]|uniref:DUF6049 family protein n=1 Tax=Demequina zhanjiangensis TaxID=3051659 RepID=A0ABT8G440_9MICO|nr:DUF6049 family protein [Demequina sp. SYSU T00b26]MDN4473868.1 DUF6049 family protein [Demequina sp. SYSU T00b26]